MFAGLNHHISMTVFGAALMYEETTQGFMWLFNAFLKCMKKKSPKTIFTDQCKAITAGIRVTMPDTFHGLCTFHLNENAAEKFKNFERRDELKKDLQYLMFGVVNEDQFYHHWKALVDEYSQGKVLKVIHGWLAYTTFDTNDPLLGWIIISRVE
ncbi:Protein FAR1-RELATED SEQUENCE 8 [Linum perenne]